MSTTGGLSRGLGSPEPSAEVRLRPMLAADVPAATTLTWQAFGIPLDSVELEPTWDARMHMMLRTDPAGAFVALDDSGQVIGVSAALARDELWVLSLLAVDPTVQSRGAGRSLIEAALGYRPELEKRLIMATNDPRAMRLYWQAGFSIDPTIKAVGHVKRERLPPADARIAEVAAADLPQLAPISIAQRGGNHTAELTMMAGTGARTFRLEDRGFVVVSATHEVWLLAALDVESAVALLWHGLAVAGEGGDVRVRQVSGANQWAIDTLMRAGLDLAADGAICAAGNPGPLYPYIPSGPLS